MSSFSSHLRQVAFFYPSFIGERPGSLFRPVFFPISITGSSCVLNCLHCKGHILRDMHHALKPETLMRLARSFWEKGSRGLLITGGSDAEGRVPLSPFLPAIREIKERWALKVVVHSGLVDEPEAEALSSAKIDLVMLDIIGSEKALEEVCHLRKGPWAFQESLRALSSWGLKVAPHIVIGLHHGRIDGEQRALEIVAQEAAEIAGLVLVVLSPLGGRLWAQPPPLSEVGLIFQRAREMMPDSPILLGCAKPMGKYKALLEAMALEKGLDGIAFPSTKTLQLAQNMGLKPRISPMCCSCFSFEDAYAQ